MKKLSLMFSLVALGVMLAAYPASAVLLGPASGALGGGDALSGSGTLVATTGVLPWANGTGTLTGFYIENVVADPARGGQLDFLIAFSLDSSATDAIGRITTSSFTGWVTDVGYNICCGGQLANSVDRSFSGSVIGWNFTSVVPPSSGIHPGGVSALLEIDTNAYYFKHGIVSVIDGGTTDLAGFAPAVPEPTSLMLFGSGLLGLGNIVRRKLFS